VDIKAVQLSAALVLSVMLAGCSEREMYHFATALSPDEQVYSMWYQNPKGGDEHWLEDCLTLAPSLGDPGRMTCSFIGITGDNLKMKWPTATHLEITYPPGTKVIKADPKWKYVTITYAEDPKLQKY